MNHPSNRTPRPKLLGLPRSGLGWSSIWLALAFFVIMWLFRLYASTSTRYRPTFFSDPLNALLLITASLAGISSGVTALLALIFKRERSLLLVLMVIFGALVALFTLSELVGHH